MCGLIKLRSLRWSTNWYPEAGRTTWTRRLSPLIETLGIGKVVLKPVTHR